jgi:prepilin-type N-terminal cleavage/methylation domain-containing protein
MRTAFTLIEVIIAVLIISTSMLFVFKMHTHAQHQAAYIKNRTAAAFEDSLFLTPETLVMHNDKKRAYGLLYRTVKLKRDNAIRHLKRTERNITTITEEVALSGGEQKLIVELSATYLQGKYKNVYYRFKLRGL